MSTLIIIIQHSFGRLSHSNQRRKGNKRNPTWKKNEIKFSLFADDTVLYIENPKDSALRLLELISEDSNTAGYKVSTQKFLALQYTTNEKSER